MQDEIGGKIIIEFIALRPKAYSYLIDDGDQNKKAKDTKKCNIKQVLNSCYRLKVVQKQLNLKMKCTKRKSYIIQNNEKTYSLKKVIRFH